MRRSDATRLALGTLGVLMGLPCSGCDDRKPELATPALALPAEGGPYRVTPVERGGAIAGRCRLAGHPTPVRLRAWPAMGTEEGQDDESVAEGEDRALGGCVVSIVGIPAGKDWPESMRGETSTFTLTAAPGHYEPHLAWVRVGTQVVLASRLAGDIYVHAYERPSGQTIANLSLAPGATAGDFVGSLLGRPAVIHITEDTRGQFAAWIHVSTHPYVEITSDKATATHAPGAYRLDDVPAGVYEVACRHEPMDRRENKIDGRFAGYVLGPPIELRRRIRVRAGETATMDFDVPAGGR